jgi:hypothetical protein
MFADIADDYDRINGILSLVYIMPGVKKRYWKAEQNPVTVFWIALPAPVILQWNLSKNRWA